MGKIIYYSNNYVLTSAGEKDFGEITPEIARIIHREQGKIRLEIGFQKNGHGYGEKTDSGIVKRAGKGAVQSS